MPKKKRSAQPPQPEPVTPPPTELIETPFARMRLIDDFRDFTGTGGLVHTSKGDIDSGDRRQRGMLDG